MGRPKRYIWVLEPFTIFWYTCFMLLSGMYFLYCWIRQTGLPGQLRPCCKDCGQYLRTMMYWSMPVRVAGCALRLKAAIFSTFDREDVENFCHDASFVPALKMLVNGTFWAVTGGELAPLASTPVFVEKVLKIKICKVFFFLIRVYCCMCIALLCSSLLYLQSL